MPKHKTRTASPVQCPQKPRDQCQKWRGTLSFPPQLKMRPFSSLQQFDMNPELPLALEISSDFPEETRAGIPGPTQLETKSKLPGTTPKKKKNTKFSPPRKMSPFYTAAFPKKSHVPSGNSKGNLTPFRKPQKLPEILVPTREEH